MNKLTIAIAFALVLGVGCRANEAGDMSAAKNEAPASPEPASGLASSVEKPAERAPAGAAEEQTAEPAADELDRRDAPAEAGFGGESTRQTLLKGKAARGRGGSEQPVQTRSWFPETFLFAPLVATDSDGKAKVEVRVPDRLTTWRVLALAHTRSGEQGGDVASFLGTLPTYVDPIVPPRLRSGDVVTVPVQVVNTTDAPVSQSLKVEVVGAELVGRSPDGAVALPAGGAALRWVTIRVARPGTARLLARLGTADSVVREIEVEPVGKPVVATQSGTLAEPRSFDLTLEGGTGGPDRVALTVFPGALSLIRAELTAAPERSGLADDAFALLLSGQAPKLLTALGDQPDPAALRELSVVLSQRVVRHARVLDNTSATLLAQSALAHDGNPILVNIGKRALAYLVDNQLPDGTCGGETGWSLPRLLVATADCARAARSVDRVVVRAGGAFARHREHVKDPYTAAAILASGAASPDLADDLEKIVIGAIRDRPDGSKVIELPPGVERADGTPPSEIEATALAVLALAGNKQAPRAALGAAVLGGYSPSSGWGDGRANLVCMQAVLELFRDPLPDAVAISLRMDGKVVVTGTLERNAVRDLLVLHAADVGAGGQHRWEVIADPPVPGLGFSLAVKRWVAWPPPADGGVALVVKPPAAAKVGAPGWLELQAQAPAGEAFTIELALPAGIQVDRPSLEALVSEGKLSRFAVDASTARLWVPPLEPAKALSATIKVIPTLRGQLASGRSALTVAGQVLEVPPATWAVD